MSVVTEWLLQRDPAPPPQLRDRLLDLLGNAGDDAPMWRVLAERGLEVLAQVLPQAHTRAAALDLLAADALLTYAGEAAAEQGVDAVEAYVTAFGPAHFAALLDGAHTS